MTVPSPGLDARHVYAGVTLADGTGALYAFDPTNGLQLWRRPLPGPAGRPLVADWGEVIVAFDDPAGGSALRAFDAGTGADRWEAAMSTRASTAPVAVGRSVVIAGPGALLRRDVDRSTAAITELTGRPDALVGTDQDGLFLLLEDQRVEARDQHGTRLWSRDGSAVAASATGGVTALLEPAGDVVGVHVRAGELWRTRVGAAGIAPVVVDDLVVVVTRTGEIVSLALADGTERSRTPWPVEVGAELTVADGRVYVPTCAGIVAADLTSDVQLWFAPLDLPAGTCAATPTVAPGDEGPLLVSEGDTLIGIRR